MARCTFHWLTALVVLILLWAALVIPAQATTNYIYPLTSWSVATKHGEDLGGGLYHMGIDAGYELSTGDTVYAIADGIVREAKERTQFGLVVLIEHFPENEDSNVSLYGHLDPSQLLVTPGQTVSAGDPVGVLGTEENNGGWAVHLHFGIHKRPYTGKWVYYGHVRDPETANEWYDPEVYIPDHLVSDVWLPTVELDITDAATVGPTADFTVTARDLGSRVKKVNYRVSANEGQQWTTLAATSDPYGDVDVQIPLNAYDDGPLLLRVVARDYFNNKTISTISVTKDTYRYTTPSFVAMKDEKSDSFVTQWSFAGAALNAFFPFRTSWAHGGDIALGDLYGDGIPEIITARGTPQHPAKIKLFSESGELYDSLRLSEFGSIRIAAGDVDNDGSDEYIVGSGKRDVAAIAAFAMSGEALWSLQPFGEETRGGFNVASGNIDTDEADEVVAVTREGPSTQAFLIDNDGTIITQFFPFRRSFSGGAAVAIGDINGDADVEFIFGTESGRASTAKIVDQENTALIPAFHPFGEEFTGTVDVSTVEWDTTDDDLLEDEAMISQANNGQALVHVYRFSTGIAELIFEKRVYEPSFEGGVRIAGYK